MQLLGYLGPYVLKRISRGTGLVICSGVLACKAALPDEAVHPNARFLDRTIEPTAHIRLATLPDGHWENPLATQEAIVSLGQPAGPEALLFGAITAAAVDAKGYLVILDRKMNEAKVFSGDSLVQTVGRAGDGPGEFRSPIGLAVDQSGTLFVADRRQVNLFQPGDDGYRFTRALPVTSFHPLSLCVRDGTAYLSGISAPDGFAIARISPTNQQASPFGVVYSSPNLLIKMQMVAGIVGCDSSRGQIIHAASALGEIRAYDTTGTLKWLTVIDDYRPLRVLEGNGSTNYVDPDGAYDVVQSVVAFDRGIAVYVARLKPDTPVQSVDRIYSLILDPNTGALMSGGVVEDVAIYAHSTNFITTTDTPAPSVTLWKIP